MACITRKCLQSHCSIMGTDLTALSLAGSSRLYEDPDIDEYEGMDDCGYIRRPISRQQDFIRYQLGMVPGDDSELLGLHNEQQGSPTGSLSSSASLSSPGFDKHSSPNSGAANSQVGGEVAHTHDLSASVLGHTAAS